MAEIRAIVATTGIVNQGSVSMMVTREAIESIPEQVAGDRAIPFMVEHDPFCLPIGKIAEAWVEPFGNEHAVVARIHIEDICLIESHRGSGIDLVRLDFHDSPKPFIDKRYGSKDQPGDVLTVDLANFDNMQGYTAFANDVSLIDDKITCGHGIARHSLGPEPLIQLVLGNPVLGAALGIVIIGAGRFICYTVDATLKKAADDISDWLYVKIKNVLKAYGRHRSEDNRSCVTQIVIPGKMELILLVKTERDEEFPTIDLKKLVSEMEKYSDLLQEASSVTFARIGTNNWELQYMKTRSGKVIGTRECYERTLRRLGEMGQDRNLEAEDAPPGD